MPPTAMRTPYPCCPLCESTRLVHERTADCSAHPLYRPPLPREQVWKRCEDCTHVFVEGPFTAEALQLLFSSTQEGQQAGHDVEASRWVSARMVEAVITTSGRAGGRWLDVGFGNGSLLCTAEEFGFDVVGIDLRADNVERMRQLGFEALCMPLESLDDASPFDVISMADVLEHMTHPRRALLQARQLLKPGGALFLSMPNSDAFVWRSLDAHGANPYWGELEHCHNFGRARLERLLRDCGLEPCRYAVSERYRACMEIIARKP